MIRSLTASVLMTLMLWSIPVCAEERASTAPVAPSPAVAAAWAREAKPSSPALRSLVVSYAVLQGLDMASTVVARNRGAVEANPMMGGSFAKGIAMKAGLSAVTILAVRMVGKKNKKAALVTMIALNLAGAAVVANNLRVARRLQ